MNYFYDLPDHIIDYIFKISYKSLCKEINLLNFHNDYSRKKYDEMYFREFFEMPMTQKSLDDFNAFLDWKKGKRTLEPWNYYKWFYNCGLD